MDRNHFAAVWIRFGSLLKSLSPVQSCILSPSSSLSIGVVSNVGVMLCESLLIAHSITCLWFSLY